MWIFFNREFSIQNWKKKIQPSFKLTGEIRTRKGIEKIQTPTPLKLKLHPRSQLDGSPGSSSEMQGSFRFSGCLTKSGAAWNGEVRSDREERRMLVFLHSCRCSGLHQLKHEVVCSVIHFGTICARRTSAGPCHVLTASCPRPQVHGRCLQRGNNDKEWLFNVLSIFIFF